MIFRELVLQEKADAGGGGIAPGLGCQAGPSGGSGGEGCRSGASVAGDCGSLRRTRPDHSGQDRAMDPQRLRDWVRRFNAAGVEGLIDRKPAGAARRLTPEQEAELAALIEAGPEFARDGVVRWRCIDLRQLILTRWNIAYHERTISKLLRRLGFRHISARPRHLGQDPAQIEEFKKTLSSVSVRSRQRLPQSRRFAYQIGLSVWCDLSQTRRGGGGGHAERQYAGDAASP